MTAATFPRELEERELHNVFKEVCGKAALLYMVQNPVLTASVLYGMYYKNQEAPIVPKVANNVVRTVTANNPVKFGRPSSKEGVVAANNTGKFNRSLEYVPK